MFRYLLAAGRPLFCEPYFAILAAHCPRLQVRLVLADKDSKPNYFIVASVSLSLVFCSSDSPQYKCAYLYFSGHLTGNLAARKSMFLALKLSLPPLPNRVHV